MNGSRVFSGIQPTGALHVGNYVGALKNWVRLQADVESIYCIVDYHAITIPYAPAEMPGRVFDAASGGVGAKQARGAIVCAGIKRDRRQIEHHAVERVSEIGRGAHVYAAPGALRDA